MDTPLDKDRFTRGDFVSVLLLFALTLSIRAWQLGHTEVSARDSVNFIRYAWQLEHDDDWRQVLRNANQHPLYPATIALVARVVRPWFPDDLPRAMQVSSQLVSAGASLVLVVAMYLLGRELFDRRCAFWGAALFQCLPASGRVLADGLSEGLFLACAAIAFWSASVGLRRGVPLYFAIAGLAGGLGYLTRPEGGVIVAAIGLALLIAQVKPAWRKPWLRTGACAAALAVPALVCALPYIATIGRVTAKPTGSDVLKNLTSTADRTGQALACRVVMLADWDDRPGIGPQDRYGWASKTLVRTFVYALGYIGPLLVLIGLWRRRRLFVQHPGHWMLLLVGLPLTFFLYRVAVLYGYLSERHMLLIVLGIVCWGVAGTIAVGETLARTLVRLRPSIGASRWGDVRVWVMALLVALTGLPLIRTLSPLHADRVGFREAGYWIAHNAQPGDQVEDAYCWAHYYAGRVFTNGKSLPAQTPTIHYVVLEHSTNPHPRLHHQTEKEVRDKGGVLRNSWPVRRGRETAEIRVYEVPGPMPPPRDEPLRLSKQRS